MWSLHDFEPITWAIICSVFYLILSYIMPNKDETSDVFLTDDFI